MNEAEILKSITFFGFFILIILFSILSVFASRILYSLLFAVISFFSAGGIFFSLGADYNAVVQIAIYGVAVPVIFLFAIMFTSNKENRFVNISFAPRFFIGFASVSLLFLILWYSAEFAIHLNPKVEAFFSANSPIVSDFNSIISIANGMYVSYQISFLTMALLILTVIVGVSVLNVIKEKNRG